MKRENKLEILLEIQTAADAGGLAGLARALEDRIQELKDNNAVIKPPLDIDLFNYLPVVGRKIVLVCLQQDGPIGFRIVLMAGIETTAHEPQLPNFAWTEGNAIPVLSVMLDPTGIKDMTAPFNVTPAY